MYNKGRILAFKVEPTELIRPTLVYIEMLVFCKMLNISTHCLEFKEYELNYFRCTLKVREKDGFILRGLRSPL